MIFRWLGNLCIISALFILSLGIYLWLVGVDITQVAGKVWFDFDQPSLQTVQVVIERYLYASWFWTFFQGTILSLPAWDAILRVFITLMVTGGLLVGLFKKPHGKRKRRRNL